LEEQISQSQAECSSQSEQNLQSTRADFYTDFVKNCLWVRSPE